MKKRVVLLILGIIILPVIWLALSANNWRVDPPSLPTSLVSSIENVTSADGYVYHAKDDKGVGMDALKIIPNPQGGYLGIYHHQMKDILQVRIATSKDMLHWHYRRTLPVDVNASQSTIDELTNGGFLIAFERGIVYSNIEFVYYPNIKMLLSNKTKPAKTFIVPWSIPNQVETNEGTPNIISDFLNPDIDHSVITIGFHFRADFSKDPGDLAKKSFKVSDQEAEGTLINFKTWTAHENTEVNQKFANQGIGIINGIGDRDLFYYNGSPYIIIEALTGNIWSIYIYDETYKTLTKLSIHTQKGSKSFGNPTYTELLLPNGTYGFVVTLFIHSEGGTLSQKSEAGEFIYYKAFPVDATDQLGMHLAKSITFANIKRYPKDSAFFMFC